MKLVRPGAGAPKLSENDAGAMRRLRLGRLAGSLLAAGWLLTLALAATVGTTPDASGLLLALAGAGMQAAGCVGAPPRPGGRRHRRRPPPPSVGPAARALAAPARRRRRPARRRRDGRPGPGRDGQHPALRRRRSAGRRPRAHPP